MERKLIAIAVASAMGLPMAADAVEGSVSGRVNSAVVMKDDGDAKFMNGNGSEARFTFKGSEELDNGMTAGVTLEVGAGGGVYEYADEDLTDDKAGNDLRVRHAHVYLSSAAAKLTIGQQGTATSSSSFADVGSSWIAGATNWCSYGIDGGPTCTTNDAARKQVVRYDSPALGPLSAAVSAGNGDFFDYYKRGENENDGEGSLWGIGIAHSLGGGVTAYAGYRFIENDGMDEETDGILAGVQVMFN